MLKDKFFFLIKVSYFNIKIESQMVELRKARGRLISAKLLNPIHNDATDYYNCYFIHSSVIESCINGIVYVYSRVQI